jgi:Flagellar hook-length control protein FliK
MPISVNPTVPVITAQGAASAVVLQPGTVINAQVLKILGNDLVQIAIANLSIDVLSQVPLQAGQNLQLAVSQTETGIRLAVVGQGAAAPAGGAPSDSVTLAPGATVASASLTSATLASATNASATNAVAVTNPPVSAASPINALTPIERTAVSAAVQTAVTQQGSLAPLFANLGVVASTGGLPPALQQAMAQVLAQRSSLDQNLSGDDLKNAFESSGLFLEASLASGSASTASGPPDLKAALIVLRQTLVSSLGTADSPAAAPTAPPSSVLPSAVATAPDTAAANEAATPPATMATTPAPSLSPELDAQELFLPQIVSSAALPDAGARAATAGALNLLQEVLQGNLQQNLRDITSPSLALAMPQNGAGNDEITVHTNTPPPPFRGAQPSAQPIASPSIAPGAPLAISARHLLDDTDAAIARQTLLQVASLPGQVDTSASRLDPAVPRWNFEIPFVTPQGTAVAQFEISRDGAGNETEAAKRIWRARFSLDVGPSGPVHAMVSLSGDRTSVRMWAERPATAEQLQAGVSQLSQALTRAELLPGDIVVRVGAPAQSASAPAGHFLDRAL